MALFYFLTGITSLPSAPVPEPKLCGDRQRAVSLITIHLQLLLQHTVGAQLTDGCTGSGQLPKPGGPPSFPT